MVGEENRKGGRDLLVPTLGLRNTAEASASY